MATTAQQPVISPPAGPGAPEGADRLDLGGTRGFRRIASRDTGGVFSVIELVAEPGQGVDLHVHDHEDELVHVVEGAIEVTLGDQTMTAPAGVVALLPRGIPHGFVNKGDAPARVMDVILPGGFDEYFVAASDLVKAGKATDEAFAQLNQRFSVRFL